jgi:hypothetical protein
VVAARALVEDWRSMHSVEQPLLDALAAEIEKADRRC